MRILQCENDTKRNSDDDEGNHERDDALEYFLFQRNAEIFPDEIIGLGRGMDFVLVMKSEPDQRSARAPQNHLHIFFGIERDEHPSCEVSERILFYASFDFFELFFQLGLFRQFGIDRLIFVRLDGDRFF